MRTLPFSKLSGAGNDFILIEASRTRGFSGPALARRLCRRRAGIGADGLLLVNRGNARGGNVPRLLYFNADGSAAFCGNGTRCAALWMRRAGWVPEHFRLRTSAGVLEARAAADESVSIAMPDAGAPREGLRLAAAGATYRVDSINTGVPHAVVRLGAGRIESFPVREVGRALRRHSAFKPAGANVNFVALGPRELQLRTYERGVEDETLACGTGAIAAALMASLWTGRRSPIKVRVRSGDVLAVSFRVKPGGGFSDVSLDGPACIVYDGEVRL